MKVLVSYFTTTDSRQLRLLASLKEPVYEVGMVVKGKRRVVYE